MKKKVDLTITASIEVEIPDAMLTPEAVKLFKEFMWDIDSTDELFTHVAQMVATRDECGVFHHEGLGLVVGISMGEMDVESEVAEHPDRDHTRAFLNACKELELKTSPCPVFANALSESLGGDEAKLQAIKDWFLSPEKRRMFWHGGLGKTLLSQVIEEAAPGLGLTVVEQFDPNGVLFLRGDPPSVSEPFQPTLTIEFVLPSSKASRSDLANDLAAELPGIRAWLGLLPDSKEG